jgi:putative holliday junction resolvase
MRYLAIDYGNKRTGLAVCDPGEVICSPLCVLQTGVNIWDRVAKTAHQERAQAYVVGLPLNMDGSEGFQAERVRTFAKQLAKVSSLPIHFQDERLTSFSASEKYAQMELSKGKKKKHIDALAAAEILTAFLEARQEKATE